MTDPDLKKEFVQQDKEEMSDRALNQIKWSQIGKADLLDLLLETHEMSITDAVKVALSGPHSDEAMELINFQRYQLEGMCHE